MLISLLVLGGSRSLSLREEYEPLPHLQSTWTINSLTPAHGFSRDDDNNANNEIPVLGHHYLDDWTSTPLPPSAPSPIQLPVVNRPLQVSDVKKKRTLVYFNSNNGQQQNIPSLGVHA